MINPKNTKLKKQIFSHDDVDEDATIKHANCRIVLTGYSAGVIYGHDIRKDLVVMAFIRYTNTGSRLGAPKISIWTRGQLGFNQAAVLKYGIDSYKYAVLYFDPDENMVGVRVTNEGAEDGAVKMIIRENAGASFSAIPFLRTYNIDYTETQRYDFDYVKDDKMFVFQPKIEEE